MFSINEVERLIRAGDLAISYSFARFDDNPAEYLDGEQFVDMDRPELPATRMFSESFFGDRLRLTLGPIVMSHTVRRKKGRSVYRNRPGYFDLRESGALIVEPDETISVSTNERIRLSPKVGAYILPRLRNTDSGLLYVPSYIDPYWDGILQAVVVNLTKSRQRLALCEGLAICRFYPIQGEVPEETRDQFPAKSHHFGQSWPKILNEDAEPFPRRKLPVPSSRLQEFVQWVQDEWSANQGWLKPLGVTTGLVALAVTIGRLSAGIEQTKEMESELKRSKKEIQQVLTVDLPRLRREMANTASKVSQSGSVDVPVADGKLRASYSFQVKRAKGVTTTIWVAPDDSGAAVRSVTGRISPSPTDDDRSTITIEVFLDQKLIGDHVTVKWLLVP